MLLIHRSVLCVLAAAVAFGASACGEDKKESSAAKPKQPAAARGVALPDSSARPATLVAGKRYSPAIFRPRMSFVLPENRWETAEPESERSLAIRLAAPQPTRRAILAFVRVERVFDPQKGGRTAADGVAAPKDFADWLERHPRLKSEPAVSVEVGGALGRQVDVTVRQAPQRCETPDGPQPCLRLYLSGDVPIEFGKGDRLRYMVLDVGGEQLVVELYISPGQRFEAVLPDLEAAIKQLSFEPT